MYSTHGMGAALKVRRRGVGEVSPLNFPFLAQECAVGSVDPATGDTIAGCLGPPPPAPPVPTIAESMTVTAKAYPTWLYVGAAVLGSVFLLKLVKK